MGVNPISNNLPIIANKHTRFTMIVNTDNANTELILEFETKSLKLLSEKTTKAMTEIFKIFIVINESLSLNGSNSDKNIEGRYRINIKTTSGVKIFAISDETFLTKSGILVTTKTVTTGREDNAQIPK